MNKTISFLWVLLLSGVVAPWSVSAVLTTNWPFITPSQYSVSDPGKIEVGDGVAKLKLLNSKLYTLDRSAYLTNDVQLTDAALGRNSSFGLISSNGVYASSGVYVSRVIDGGSGNSWTGMAMRFSNKSFGINSASPIQLSDSGIINDPGALALYHFDGTWGDEVTSLDGTPVSSPQFTNDSFFGAQALALNGANYFQTRNSALLNGRSSGTVVCWVKLASRNNYAGLVATRGSGELVGLAQSGSKVSMYVYLSSAASANDLPLGRWCFIAGTFGSGFLRVYIDGRLEGTFPFSGTVQQSNPFCVGLDAYSPDRKSTGLFDEVAVYGRELSATEVQNLYYSSSSLGVKLRSGSTTNLTGSFVGPNGDSNKYYVDNMTPLQIQGAFNPADRYLQYEATLYANTNKSQSPFIDSIKFIGTAGEVVDDVWGDLVQGSSGVGSTNIPARHDTPFVALGMFGNGVVSNGVFTSRVFDAGSEVNWSKLFWDRGIELATPLSGLEGLWHMNASIFSSWVDSSGKGHASTVSGATFTPYAKLGAYSAVFNGSNAWLNVGNLGAAVQTVEFWMKAELPSTPVLELGPTAAWLMVSNNIMTVNGWGGATPAIYVNGEFRPQLLPGWNHVAVVFPSVASASNVTVGLVRGGYFKGLLDELAVYNRALTTAEIAADCVAGRRDAAGRIRFRARADNVNPPQADFVGKDGTTATYLDDASGSDLLIVFDNKRYFQYQATLDGDGADSPALRSVTVTYGSGQSTNDRTKDDFLSGDNGGGSTRVVGDEIMLRPLVSSGPATVKPAESLGLLGLWRMDDTIWTVDIPSAVDASGNSRWGTPKGDSRVNRGLPAVGLKNGVFASTGYLSIPGADLSTNDFSISGWFKTTSITRSPLASNYAGAGQPYFGLEMNGNGSVTLAGQAAFVLSDGSTTVAVVGYLKSLNDGAWHHISGVRSGGQALLYIDGILAGAAPLAIGSAGAGTLTLAKYGTQSLYFTGSLDEFALHGRALSESEIGDLAASGYMTRLQGVVVGPALGVGLEAYWEKLYWGCDAPYGRALKKDDSMAGLWHCDSVSNNITEDASTNANWGTVTAGATVNAAGRFGGCLNLGAGKVLQITDSSTLRVNTFSIEAWIYASNTVSLTVAQKQAGTGFILGTDSTGRPTFTVNGTTCTDYDVLRARKWNLLCGTYDGQMARLYVNGLLRAVVPVTGSAAAFADLILGGTLNGGLDEAVLYGRAISSREAFDHYRSGVCAIKFQVRTWDPGLQGNFLGPDGTTNTFFTDYEGSSFSNATSIAKYLQAKAYLSSEDARFSPRLESVRADSTGYPVDYPWVAPADGYGNPFLGALTSFSQTLATTNSAAVQYQISGDNGSNWYAWVGGTWFNVSQFTNSAMQWAMSSPASVVSTNIGLFYNQLYQGVGGTFKFRAFLKSDAIQQVELDEVRLGYSNGRLRLTSPNGAEVANNAWVINSPYNITWLSAGSVTATNIIIELYDQSGSNFIRTIASGVTNSGVYRSVIYNNPLAAGSNYRILIRDGSDPSIFDWSDNDFELIYNLHLSIPNGGEKWYVGETNGVSWESPLATDMLLWLSNDDGLNNWVQVAAVTANAGTNGVRWAIQTHDAMLPSMTARMAVSTPDSSPVLAAFRDFSDQSFIMAGAVVTYPNASTSMKMGDTTNVMWTSAAAGPFVKIELYDGAAWNVLSSSATNVDGLNSFTCALNAPNPTEAALIRISSLSDGRIVAVSEPFLLADIRIISPKGGVSRDSWQIGTTNLVSWVSGGAGNLVNVDYSTDGVSWNSIAADYVNSNSAGSVVITNFAPLWIIQGPPSSSAVVRVTSVERPDLKAITDQFDITGLQVTSPNGGEYWEFAGTNQIRWLHRGAGFNLAIGVTYNGGATTNDYVTLDSSIFNGSPRTVNPGRLLRPSVLAKVRLVALDTLVNPIPMIDVSDGYFTIRGLSAYRPATNAVYTMGTTVTNGLQWYSAATEDSTADLFFSSDGSNYVSQIFSGIFNNDAGDSWNHYDWAVPRNLTPSTTGRVKVMAGSYQAVSPVFTLRGIRVTQPATGQVFDLGSSQSVKWLKAGLNDNAYISNVVSVAGQAGAYVSGGLPGNAYVLPRSFTWNISQDLDPSTNAVIKMMVTTPEDADIVMYSDPFVLRGAKILSPSTGTNWMVGTQQTIVYLAAGMAPGAVGNIYYSADGTTFDVANPVAVNVSMNSGINTVLWDIENTSTLTRQPSTNAVLKLISGTVTNLSRPFRMGGIKVTAPKGTDIWAVSDVTNTIQWVGVDTQPSFSLFYTVYDAPQHSAVIASGVPGFSYAWAMTSNAIGNQVTVTVTDGVTSNESPRFVIVPSPSIRIVNPVAGDFWKVGETDNVIRWAQGGNMSNDFTIGYSPYPFVITNTIAIGDFPSSNSIYSFTWGPIPNSLGQVRLVIVNNANPIIKDSLDNFKIAATFQIQPFIGDLHALEPKSVGWTTFGSLSGVDFYYSTDPFRGTNSWTLINTAGPFTSVAHAQSSSYLWNVPNIKSSTAWLRIQDHDYASTRFDAAKKGPYDDLGTFEILYYTVVWRVFDVATSNELDELSVTDSSGWSSSGLASPITREYPYGFWNTVWFKQYFNDKIILNWSSKTVSTNAVFMTRTEAAPEYHVLASFVYDPAASVFKTVAWLERSSQIIPDPAECLVYIYDSDGNQVQVQSAGAPRSTGVFWADVGALLDKNRPYFAKVEIKHSGVIYTSGITFTLLTPSESAVAAVNAARDAILGSVSNVNENVIGVGLAQQAFRTDVTNRLQGLSNMTATISLDVTGINSNLLAFSSNAMAQLGGITNTIGVIGPGDTNLLDQVRLLTQDMAKRTARIMTRPGTVKSGSTVGILYRSQAGMALGDVKLDVFNALGVRKLGPVNMFPVSGGVYESSFTADTLWGLGDFTVTCSDSSGASDRIILKVAGMELDDLAGSMTGISNQLAGVEGTLATMSVSVSNININVISVTNSLAGMIVTLDSISNSMGQVVGLTNLSGSISAMTSAVAQITVLTNMGTQLSFITNMVGQLGSLTNLNPQMASLTNSMARLQAITNTMNSLVAQMGYVTNVIDQIVILTNINSSVSAMTSAVAQISGLTNMGTQLNYLTNAMGSVQSLTNLTPQMAYLTNMAASAALQSQYLTNLLTRMSGLTNLTPQMGFLTNAVWQLQSLTNLNAQMAYLTNVIDQVTALTNMADSVSAMTSAVAQISGLTNMGAQLNYLTNAMGSLTALTSLTNLNAQIAGLSNLTASTAAQSQYLTNLLTRMSGLTNLTPQMGFLTNAVWQLQSLTNLNAQMAYLTNVIDQVTALTNMADSVSAMTSAVAQISGLTNMGSQLAYLTNAMWTMQSLTNLTPQVASLTNLTPQVASLTNLLTRMSGLTNLTPQVAYLTNSMSLLVGLTNMPAQLSSMTNVISQLTGLTNISDQVAQMTNSIATMAGMTNLPSQMNYLTNIVSQLTGLTNISDQVGQMTNSIATMAGMTNLPSQMNYLTNIISQLTGLTNISDQVAQMTNSIGQVAGLTNLPNQMNYLTNVISKLTGLTNISDQVAQMTNSIGQIAGLTNLSGQMDYMTNAMTQLGVVTGLVSQVANITNSLALMSGLTNVSDQVAYLTNLLTQMSSLTNIEAQVGAMTNSIAQISGMTNLPSQMNYLTNIVSQLTGLTNISDQVAQMTNSIATMAGMTNLPSQMNYLTNIVSQLTGLTNISDQVAQMTNSIATMAGMTNLPSQMNYLTNIISQLSGMTNISDQVSQMTNSISLISGMTNLTGQMSYLTNAMAQLGMMTNTFGSLAGLTNVGEQVAALTNLNAQMIYLTNAVGALGSLSNGMAGVVSAIGQLSALTNMGSQVAVLTNSIGQIVALTNMTGQLTDLASGMAQLTEATTTISNTLASFDATMGSLEGVSNTLGAVTTMDASLTTVMSLSSNISAMVETTMGTASDSADTDTVFGRIASLEADVAKVGGSASAAAQRASGARSQANSAAGAAQRIKNTIATSSQMGSVMTDVGVIRKALEEALANISGISGTLSTEEMVKTVKSAQDTIRQVSESRGVVVPGGAGAKVEPGPFSDQKAVESLINQLSETKAMMQATRQLMDEAVNKPVVVDWLEGSK